MNLPTVPNSSKIVDTWLAGRSEKTVLAYRRDLEVFAKWLGVKSIDEAAAKLLGHSQGEANSLVHQYRAHLIETLAPNTVNRRLAAIRSLVQIARMFGIVPWTLDVLSVKAETVKDTRGPGISAIAIGISECDDSLIGKRDRAILRLMFDLGLRVSEVAALDVSDYDGEVLKVLGKGRKSKTLLTVPPKTQAALKHWLIVHPGTECMFPSTHINSTGHRLTTRAIQSMTQRRVGCSPHKIRHTAITTAIGKADNLADVQAFSRHSDIRTVLIYYDRNDETQGELARRVSEGA
jgi:integrase/recombinase XerC